MAQALSADNYVHEGVWINWHKGSVLGLTLTVNPQHAAIISPALAIFISIAGIQLWHLIQFTLHQFRARPGPQPMIYHQTQVTLRNSPTDLDTFWQLIRIGISWRQILPVLPLALWTLLHFSLLLSFGLFSSLLLESNDEVLSRSPWCGDIRADYINNIYSPNNGDPEIARLKSEYNKVVNSRFISAQQRVDICTNSSNSCRSNIYRSNKLNWTSTYIADDCPFNSSICHPDTGMLSLDSGFLSSHSDLGLNAPVEDRISIRMLNKCAPLDNAKHSLTWQNVSTAEGIRQLADISYGNFIYNKRNSTYSLWRKPVDCEQRLTDLPYILMAALGEPGTSIAGSNSSWDPTPELRLSDADTSLIVLAYNDAYLQPVRDPWFSAQQTTSDYKAFCSTANITLYTRELPLTAMSCSLQWQFCNTDKTDIRDNSCTPLLGRAQTYKLLTSPTHGISLNLRQLATAYRLSQVIAKANFYYAVQALSQSGSLPLRARFLLKSVANGYSPGLPADQWQTEARYWMEIIMAYVQQVSIDYSTGQWVASTSYINVTQPSVKGSNIAQDAKYWVCQSQIITSRAYRNFNFFALLITSISCIVVIIAGLTIGDCAAYCRKRRPKHNSATSRSKTDMWMANSSLYQLRSIDELRNGTNWTLSKNGIPRTHPGYQVAIRNLAADGHEIEEGKGVVSPAVRRHFSSQINDPSARSSMPRSLGKDGTFHPRLGRQSFTSFTYHNSGSHETEARKSPVQTVIGQRDLKTDDYFTFSNSIQTSDNRSKRNSLSFTSHWPWFNLTALPKRTGRSDVLTNENDEQELITLDWSRHARSDINRM